MMEILKKEIKFLQNYIKYLKQRKSRKMISSATADSRITESRIKIKELKDILSKILLSKRRTREIKELRRLKKLLKFKRSLFELQDEIKEISNQYTLKEIKKEFHPLVYRYIKRHPKINAVYPFGPQPPTLGRHPASDDSPRAKAIAAWHTFQQLPVSREIVLEVSDIPSSMKYLGEINHLVYFTSKWSRRGGIKANLKDKYNIIPENVDVNYIHRWNKNKMHLLKHPERNLYYIGGTCKVLDVGIDDSDEPNPPPNESFNYDIPSYVSEIGKLVEINYTTPSGERKTLHFDSESTYVCTDGEGLKQRLFLLKDSKRK